MKVAWDFSFTSQQYCQPSHIVPPILESRPVNLDLTDFLDQYPVALRKAQLGLQISTHMNHP